MPARGENPTLSTRLDRMLNNADHPSKKRFDTFIAALVILSSAILLFGDVTHDENWSPPLWLLVMDYTILTVFLLEYLARLAFAKPDLPEVVEISTAGWLWYHVQSRIRWMLTPLAMIDFLAVLPIFFVGHTIKSYELFRVLRILRLLRLYRLAFFYRPFTKLARAFQHNALLYVVALSLVGLIVIMGALAFHSVEGNRNPGVDTIFDSIWWTVVTLTTVGYGDTVPSTVVGRVIGIALMLSGVSLMAAFAGVMSQTLVGYLLDVREERVRMSTTVNHFIICGWNSRGPMVVDELAHLAPDEKIIVFADREEPSDLPLGITFLRGNPTKESEWDKVRAAVSKNIIVLALPGDTGSDYVTSDGYTGLVVFTIRSYERKLPQKGIKRSRPLHISAELLDPENVERVRQAGADEVIHTAQIGSNLIAHSSVKPGMGRVVKELISWWGQGINLQPPPAELEAGATFADVAAKLRREKGYLSVGLMSETGAIILNPPDHRPVLATDTMVVIQKQD